MPDLRIGTVPVVLNNMIPRLHIGDEIIPRGWLVQMLARYVPKRCRPTTFRRGVKLEREQILNYDGKLFMTSVAWKRMQEGMPL